MAEDVAGEGSWPVAQTSPLPCALLCLFPVPTVPLPPPAPHSYIVDGYLCTVSPPGTFSLRNKAKNMRPTLSLCPSHSLQKEPTLPFPTDSSSHSHLLPPALFSPYSSPPLSECFLFQVLGHCLLPPLCGPEAASPSPLPGFPPATFGVAVMASSRDSNS